MKEKFLEFECNILWLGGFKVIVDGIFLELVLVLKGLVKFVIVVNGVVVEVFGEEENLFNWCVYDDRGVS